MEKEIGLQLAQQLIELALSKETQDHSVHISRK